MKSICSGWEFVKDPTDAFLKTDEAAPGAVTVRLPHTVALSPLHYAAPEDYAGVFGYRRKIAISDLSKRYFLRFDGAAHAAELFVNGKKAGEHFCGYTCFRAEITDFIREGENLVSVRLDTTERADVPPFGFMMDYLGYGGLYREAWLEERGSTCIESVLFDADDRGRLTILETTLSGEARRARYEVWDGDSLVAEREEDAEKRGVLIECVGVIPWSPETPKLCELKVSVYGENGDMLDEYRSRFGFRTALFKADGFYLNGKKTFLRGLNRHQCWPYIGYAAPKSLQYEDARILKEELCLTAVRTSHYPQSQSFIDACDELGLLVFTELPGWQHIGDEKWKERSVENVREMVLQYRHHPSIILWGVRINESPDDDEFYKKTNEAAHALDPTRATSGVRCFQKSHLLEDVYAYNDFSHSGSNAGCRKKKKVTPDMGKALLISEHNGHMFPTKPFDNSARRQENALRHARVLDAAYSDGEHAGCFGWCMFDYATHKDFGSGDRVCYHGVTDLFRNPKLSAATYRSQGGEPFLEIGSSMDIGDYPAGILGEVFIFTNADEVDLYRNDRFVTTLRPKKAGLPHPPIALDDVVGGLLAEDEGYKGKKERLVRESLNAAAKYGMDGLPLSDKLKMARCMLFHGLTYDDGTRLYGKYVGNWGGVMTTWRFDAKIGGKVVVSKTRGPSRKLRLEVKASSTELFEGDIYDMAAVRIRLVDENGMTASYAQLPVKLELTGEAELIGPDTVTAEGGMTGTFIKTVGKKGAAKLTVSTPQTEPVTLEFEVK